MGTTFSTVYSNFVNSKITDYDLVALTDSEFEAILKQIFLSAISEFTNCKVDLSYIDISDITFLADTGIVADTYLVSTNPVTLSYVKDMIINFIPESTNVGSATINVDSVGAVEIKNEDGITLVAEDIMIDEYTTLVYNGTYFQIVSSPYPVFEQDLSSQEIEILATLMVKKWLDPQIWNIMLTKQLLNNKDWNVYSQANHLKELRALRNDIMDDIDRLMINYMYYGDDLSELI